MEKCFVLLSVLICVLSIKFVILLCLNRDMYGLSVREDLMVLTSPEIKDFKQILTVMHLMESERKRLALIDTAREFINKTASLVMDHFAEPDIESQLAELRKTVLKYCKSDILYKIEIEILQEMDQIMADSDPNQLEDLSFDEIIAKLKQNKHINLEEEKLKEHPWYKEFEHKLSTLRKQGNSMETDDEDFVPTQVIKHYIDPFTKQIMQQPMKNIRCGHSYDRVAVISMLKHKKNLRCPYTLCNAFVVEKDLEENVDLLNEIRKSQNSR